MNGILLIQKKKKFYTPSQLLKAATNMHDFLLQIFYYKSLQDHPVLILLPLWITWIYRNKVFEFADVSPLPFQSMVSHDPRRLKTLVQPSLVHLQQANPTAYIAWIKGKGMVSYTLLSSNGVVLKQRSDCLPAWSLTSCNLHVIKRGLLISNWGCKSG